ncbi:MAG: type II secretion system F family protein [Candidatus Omnitrophica bacterium]|nr:type II secretion system F family protein [Candidatus Omnitrophota bacterium]MDD5512863.1 type II secretion system F family protein [Candidatus Omnitrophota bacterium]
MEIMIALLLATSIYFSVYGLVHRGEVETHLPSQVFDRRQQEAQARFPGIQRKSWTPLTARYKELDKKLKPPFDLRRKLIKAGSPMGTLEFLTFFLLSLVGIPTVAMILLGDNFPKQNILLFSGIVGLAVPVLWLRSTIRKRQFNMRRDLPNLIDLLNICVSGGLDFMLAVTRVIRDMKPCDLTMELAEVQRETQMGLTRKEALKNLAWRIDMPEVYSFVRTLVQADRMGTSIGEALKIQADELRVRRFQRGEAMALKAPVKLLFPLFAFILPVVLIIVAAPILLQFVGSSGQVGFGF